MKIGDLVKPKDFVTNRVQPGIIIEIQYPKEKHPDYRRPATIKCSFPERTIQEWYYKHELEVLLENR